MTEIKKEKIKNESVIVLNLRSRVETAYHIKALYDLSNFQNKIILSNKIIYFNIVRKTKARKYDDHLTSLFLLLAKKKLELRQCELFEGCTCKVAICLFLLQ